jgi:glycosyltransferase involved in cell wall biosynthesis
MQASGGVERVISTLSEKLSLKYDITILVKDDPISFYPLAKSIKIDTINNALVFNMNNQLIRLFSVVSTIFSTPPKLRKYFNTHTFDFYYAAHPLNVLELNLAGIKNNKIIISEHGAESAYNPAYKLIKFLSYRRCVKYVVPTKTETIVYQKKLLPAVYLPHFRSNLPYSLSPKDKNIVISIGRLTAEKQQYILLNIWKRIIHVHGRKEWLLQLVGNGELKRELNKQVRENNLESYVQILPPTLKVDQHYKEASIFVLTSFSEGFGMVLLEAISFGLPCISFDCPSGPRDIIKHNVTGYLIEPNNEILFEKALLSLLEDKLKMQKMGEEAFRSSKEWEDTEILKKWEEVLQ